MERIIELMKTSDIIKEKAHTKMWAKIKGLDRKITKQELDLKNESYNPFIPRELHEQVLAGCIQERELYKYLLSLIEKDGIKLNYKL